jgi:hypothetical protein
VGTGFVARDVLCGFQAPGYTAVVEIHDGEAGGGSVDECEAQT